MKPSTTIFFLLLGVTITFWVLRGVGLLTFFPGGVIWVLIFLTVGAGIIDVVQKTRRW